MLQSNIHQIYAKGYVSVNPINYLLPLRGFLPYLPLPTKFWSNYYNHAVSPIYFSVYPWG